MSTEAAVHVICNPASAAGATGRRWPHLREMLKNNLGDGVSFHITTRRLDATAAARRAVLDGCRRLIVVGGDGTIHEAANGMVEGGKMINPDCPLGIICSGTAGDLSRSFGMSTSLDEQVKAALAEPTRTIDLGRVSCRALDGTVQERIFINESQQGIAAEVVRRVTGGVKWLGGFLAFGVVAVQTFLSYRESRMKITVDGVQVFDGRFLDIVAANGSYAGGGMKFAPHARPDDGLLDIVLIDAMSITERLQNFPKIYPGRHVDLPWVQTCRGRRVTVETDSDVLCEADGELLGTTPCTIDLLPGVLKLCI